jgi:hypothetical protein
MNLHFEHDCSRRNHVLVVGAWDIIDRGLHGGSGVIAINTRPARAARAHAIEAHAVEAARVAGSKGHGEVVEQLLVLEVLGSQGLLAGVQLGGPLLRLLGALFGLRLVEVALVAAGPGKGSADHASGLVEG